MSGVDQSTRRQLVASAALLLAGCGGGGDSPAPAPTPTPPPPPPAPPPPAPPPAQVAPGFVEASVHDPSVIRVDGQFYVFGSHLAAARSADLLAWAKIADGVTATNPLFTNVTTELAEALAWAQTNTLWAADVARLDDGRYRFFYNACKGDSPRSALGVAVADSVTGPYRNQKLVLKSGQWGLPSEDGTVYDATKHPNVVDPQAFKDAAGLWWMVYGSYSGGLFILRLDAQTGEPLPGQGYGKHLMGGNHARIEGAYVLYSPQTQYYYLFCSFGGLDANGGYNVRVARSRNPDGPYVDAAGKDMSTVKSNPALPLFDDASIAPHGVKLMGNHQFTLAAGQSGAAPGYVSPGHNSAYYDAATQQYFLIFHSRFPGRGEQHEIRVHEFHLNEDGWPVVAPLRYAPLSLATPAQTAAVSAAQAAGSYQLVNHGKDISAAIKPSAALTVASGGALSGALTGTWAHGGSNRITLTVGGVAYKGQLSRQWHANANAFVIVFSAVSAEGVSLWGIRTGD